MGGGLPQPPPPSLSLNTESFLAANSLSPAAQRRRGGGFARILPAPFPARAAGFRLLELPLFTASRGKSSTTRRDGFAFFVLGSLFSFQQYTQTPLQAEQTQPAAAQWPFCLPGGVWEGVRGSGDPARHCPTGAAASPVPPLPSLAGAGM